MLQMDERRVKRILGGRDVRLKEIHNRILAIHDELLDTDSLLESASMKKIELGREGNVKGGIKQDLADALLRHRKMAQERELELREELRQLVEEEEQINRVWVCFRTLRGKEYLFLEKQYVQGKSYKTAEMESGVSHKTFEMYRQSGIRKILQMYHSEFSNIEIIRRSNSSNSADKDNKRKRKKTHKADGQYVQLKLDI